MKRVLVGVESGGGGECKCLEEEGSSESKGATVSRSLTSTSSHSPGATPLAIVPPSVGPGHGSHVLTIVIF